MESILEGVKVVELATYAAAPGTARMLADWGATVIKVESPGGDAMRAFSKNMGMPDTDQESPIFQLENANKTGICIDLKKPGGLEVLHKLLEDADVFVTNTRLKSLTKLGLDYESLAPKYPKLIWAHTSGLGTDGPEAYKPGFDITAYWARSGGLMDMVQPG